MNSISLKDFISASLVSIVEGVRDAQQRTGGTEQKIGRSVSGIGAAVCVTKQHSSPASDNHPTTKLTTVERQGFLADPVQRVEFDIAVTVENRDETNAQAEGSLGGRIQVFGLAEIDAAKVGGHIDTTRAKSDTMVSRIKFTVPVMFDTSERHVLLNTDVIKS